jgi:hypothetical protein
MIVATFPDWAELESLSARLAAGVRDMMLDVPGDRLAATLQALITIIRISAKRGDNAAVQNLFQAAVAAARCLMSLLETHFLFLRSPRRRASIFPTATKTVSRLKSGTWPPAEYQSR